ncbi:hypothetical protein BCR42DRAFT_436141 [Absidia repens]|uniref:Uncharacterized protein n=1 Tax=Absidia repens TaxID=90262 RepID=A0A1X2IM09_9FUNG|nr:hypothetical protein BCR42DRAFT_436141 [Absidia repens]
MNIVNSKSRVFYVFEKVALHIGCVKSSPKEKPTINRQAPYGIKKTSLLNQDQARPSKTKQDQARPSKTKQVQTRPSKTKQDQTRPNKTKQDQTRPKQDQSKTKARSINAVSFC